MPAPRLVGMLIALTPLIVEGGVVEFDPDSVWVERGNQALLEFDVQISSVDAFDEFHNLNILITSNGPSLTWFDMSRDLNVFCFYGCSFDLETHSLEITASQEDPPFDDLPRLSLETPVLLGTLFVNAAVLPYGDFHVRVDSDRSLVTNDTLGAEHLSGMAVITVPEPSALLLLALGAIALGATRPPRGPKR